MARKKQKMKVKRRRRSPLTAKRIKTAMLRQLNSKIKKLRIRLNRPIKLHKTKMESQVLRSKTFSLLST